MTCRRGVIKVASHQGAPCVGESDPGSASQLFGPFAMCFRHPPSSTACSTPEPLLATAIIAAGVLMASRKPDAPEGAQAEERTS